MKIQLIAVLLIALPVLAAKPVASACLDDFADPDSKKTVSGNQVGYRVLIKPTLPAESR